MGAILKSSDQQGCHIWYYRVARTSVDTQTSSPAVIPRVTKRSSACFTPSVLRIVQEVLQHCTRDVHAGDYKLPLPINSLRNRLGFPFAGDYSWFNPIFIPLNRSQ